MNVGILGSISGDKTNVDIVMDCIKKEISVPPKKIMKSHNEYILNYDDVIYRAMYYHEGFKGRMLDRVYIPHNFYLFDAYKKVIKPMLTRSKLPKMDREVIYDIRSYGIKIIRGIDVMEF